MWLVRSVFAAWRKPIRNANSNISSKKCSRAHVHHNRNKVAASLCKSKVLLSKDREIHRKNKAEVSNRVDCRVANNIKDNNKDHSIIVRSSRQVAVNSKVVSIKVSNRENGRSNHRGIRTSSNRRRNQKKISKIL